MGKKSAVFPFTYNTTQYYVEKTCSLHLDIIGWLAFSYIHYKMQVVVKAPCTAKLMCQHFFLMMERNLRYSSV